MILQNRVLVAMGAILIATLVVLGILISIPWPTVVDVRVVVDRADLTIDEQSEDKTTGPSAKKLPDPISTVTLFTTTDLQSVRVTGPDSVHAVLDEVGSVQPRPLPNGWLRATSSDFITAHLDLQGRSGLTLRARPGTQSGASRLELGLQPDPGSRWQLELSGPSLSLQLADVELPAGDGAPVSRLIRDQTFAVPAIGPGLRFAGTRALGSIVLTLRPLAPASTRVTVLNPETGELLESHQVPLALSEGRSIIWRDSLVLLEPVAAPEPTPLFTPDLEVRDLRFFSLEKKRGESGILGGRISFPDGEKEPIEIGPRSFLSLASRQPLILRSLRVGPRALELNLSGRVKRLRLGATPNFQSELLPSLFLWIYTSKLRGLIYATVASILGASVTLFKLFGLFEKPSGGTMPKRPRRRWSGPGLLIFAMLIATSGRASAQDLETLLKAQTVMITVTPEDSGATSSNGSGVLLCQEESQTTTFILTARHVISGSGKAEISFFQSAVPTLEDRVGEGGAIIRHFVPKLDLLLLEVQVAQRLVVANMGKAPTGSELEAAPEQTHAVTAIGQSQGKGWSERSGVLTGRDGPMLVHSAATEPGFSGGPLFDSAGTLIGINVLELREETGSRIGGHALAIDEIIPAIYKWLPASCLQRTREPGREARRAYRDAMRAVQLKRWVQAEELLNKVIAIDFVEGGPIVHLQGMRYTPFLPHYHLGLAIYKQKQRPNRCDDALREWALSETQGIIQDNKRYRKLNVYQSRCRVVIKKRFEAAVDQRGKH